MLRSIGMRNYRAFRSAKYPIKPVTIFLGANSVGKTSALQLPLMLKQTAAVAGNGYSSALKVHGREVSFGQPKNLFHKQNTEDQLRINLSVSEHGFHQFLTRDLANNFKSVINNLIQFVVFTTRGEKNKIKLGERVLRRLIERSDASLKEFLSSSSTIIEDVLSLRDALADIPTEELERFSLFRPSQLFYEGSARNRQTRGHLNVKTISRSDLERTFSLISSLSELPYRTYEFEFGIRLTGPEINHSLKIDHFSISTSAPKGSRNILTIDFAETGNIENCSSDFLPPSEINSYNSVLSDNLVTGSDIFSFVRSYTESVRYIFPETLRQICSSATSLLLSTFSDGAIRHIGPLRAHPKRFYFLDTAQTGSAEGDSLVEALRENPALKKQVNDWLRRFGVNLNVNQFQEIIHRLAIKSDSNSFELDITDVGFGISQILPILVEGYISPPGTIVLVEQPEIHLHPKMQGDLADLFIAMSGARSLQERDAKASAPQRYFIVETHSEYLLNRLRRRIAEGAVSHEDVAIIIADPHPEGSTTLESIAVSEDGSFKWPIGFQEATLDDALAFAQAVAKSKKS